MGNTRFESILRRGVAEIITETGLLTLLNSGRILKLKQGFDPSAPDIHLGHVVGLRKLRQFQDLGHRVILIVGDWTARIGDPSGRSVARPMLSPETVAANAQTYMQQFFKVVDRDRTEVRWQSEWFSKFTLSEVIDLASKFTVARLLAREDFNYRYKSGSPISLSEMLYPLLQAYDSVAIEADVEFGGIDQKFNCLIGRELQQTVGQRPQQILLVPLLLGTDGSQKMSKSLNNYIGIAEPPREIYGKLMSIPDSLIIDYFELLTDVSDEEITEFKEQLKTRSTNPMNIKKRLAYEIVKQFHGSRAADEAEQHFARVFQKKETPEEVPQCIFAGKYVGDGLFQVNIGPHLVEEGLVKSMSEFKRLLAQGAIELDGNKISSSTVNARQGSILRVGKRRFVRITIKSEEAVSRSGPLL